MIVEEIMNTDLHTLSPKNTVRDAVRLMRDKKIRHLPIINEEREVVGIVTEHDIKNALPSSLRESPTSSIYNELISNIMTKNPIVGHPLLFLQSFLLVSIFYKHFQNYQVQQLVFFLCKLHVI